MGRFWGTACSAAVVAAVFVPAASSSQLIDRNAKDIQLATNRNGEALITYRAGGKLKHVLAWGGAQCDRADTGPGDRSRSSSTTRAATGSTGATTGRRSTTCARPTPGHRFHGRSRRASRPTARYWALQAWQRELPDLGLTPQPAQAVWELRLSHWTGDLPQLDIHMDWAYRRYDHLFGTLTYKNMPEFGFASTAGGEPLDTLRPQHLCRHVRLCVRPGVEAREQLPRPHRQRRLLLRLLPTPERKPAARGRGLRYRATVIGPGVTPDVTWEGLAPGPYDASLDAQANDEIRALDDRQCKPN